MIKVEVARNIDYQEWNDLLLGSSDSTVFHTLEWINVLSNTYPSRHPLYIIARDESGKMMGGLATLETKKFCLQTISTPSLGSPVLADVAGEEVRQALLQQFCDLRKRRTVIYSRLDDNSKSCCYLKSHGFRKSESYTHVLDLEPSLEDVWRKLSKYTRKNVRLAERNGVVITEVDSISQVRQYYDISVHTHKRLSGNVGYPLSFFENVFHYMEGKGLVRWHLAEKDATVLAGTLHLVYKDTVFDLLDASYSEFWNLRSNFLLVWSMIKWATENGYKYYNFGGSPPDASGLIEFKERWGATRRNFNSYTQANCALKLFQTINNAWKHLVKLRQVLKGR